MDECKYYSYEHVEQLAVSAYSLEEAKKRMEDMMICSTDKIQNIKEISREEYWEILSQE